jgi:hypothetical protein
MEVTLIVVTLLSIALAIAMGILTWRLLQEERLRSEARVAALEQGLAETLQDAYVTQAAASSAASAAGSSAAARSAAVHADKLPSFASASASPSPSSAAVPSMDTVPNDLFARDDTDWLAHFPASTVNASVAARNGAVPFKADPFAANDVSLAAVSVETAVSVEKGLPVERRSLLASDETAAAEIDDAPIAVDDVAADTVVNANGGLFGQVDADENHVGWPRHVLAVAAVAAVMIGAVIAFWTIGRLMEPATDRAATAAAAGAVAGAGAGANGATTALELMSLHQEMQDGTLKISGLVRNPRGGVPQERLTAVVFFFDGQGGFLSSTRAPLDYRALAPGEESPFQLSAPAPAGVARYRVSFRRDEGAVVPHIDRRQQVQQSLHTQPDQRSAVDSYVHPGHGLPSLWQEARRS